MIGAGRYWCMHKASSSQYVLAEASSYSLHCHSGCAPLPSRLLRSRLYPAIRQRTTNGFYFITIQQLLGLFDQAARFKLRIVRRKVADLSVLYGTWIIRHLSFGRYSPQICNPLVYFKHAIDRSSPFIDTLPIKHTVGVAYSQNTICMVLRGNQRGKVCQGTRAGLHTHLFFSSLLWTSLVPALHTTERESKQDAINTTE